MPSQVLTDARLHVQRTETQDLSSICRIPVAGALLILLALWPGGSFGFPDEPSGTSPAPPQIAEASNEGEVAIGGFRKPAGFQVTLFAAEPLVANPVAFCIDNSGRLFVCESFRQNRGVTDNRGHDTEWLEADLAAQTVADRRAYHLALLGDKAVEYTKQDDRIRRILDTDGDGKADQSTVFASGFNDLVDGTGAGVLTRGNDVFFTCIPKLYLLRDDDQDGVADSKRALHDGYGVRVAFRGHDLHGLCLGPDGRLYFSIGDRGYHVEHEGKTLHNPESGAVFRCELDGTNLEAYATGLRNPQELAFDDYGNLFTGDNNSDSGDKARWVYLVEGGDSGWRMAYQYLSDRGPFNREKLWHPHHDTQPAYIMPPVANIADGPSGLIYYPGVGLPDSFRGRFLLCDFRGAANRSGIRSFRVASKGAFFTVEDQEQPFWNILATDLALGPDGKLYISDWVDGWNGEGKGRVYQFFTQDAQSELAVATRGLLRGGFAKKPSAELMPHLGHQDQRVRLEAQFELARRKDAKTLASAVAASRSTFSRIHGIWGLGQLARAGDINAARRIAVLIQDNENEVRAQAVRALGDAQIAAFEEVFRSALDDAEPRVQYFACMALSKLKASAAVDEIVGLLERNNGVDPAIRHGGVMGLAGCASEADLVALSRHPAAAVRRAAVVALRRQASPAAAAFLDDGNPLVSVEAARAIHDAPIPSAMPLLADFISRVGDDEAMIRRVLNANYRLGEAVHAERIAAYAADSQARPVMRIEALEMLGQWARPSNRDRVLGMWRPLPARDPAIAEAAVRKHLPGLLNGNESHRKRAIEVAANLGVREIASRLKAMIALPSTDDLFRSQALAVLQALNDPETVALAENALRSNSPVYRAAGLDVIAQRDPSRAVPLLATTIRSAESAVERQAAAASLGRTRGNGANAALRELLQDLLADQISPDTQLDVLEAARGRKDARLAKLVGDVDKQLEGPLTNRYRMALVGGNAARGAKIFYERTNVSCVRCHKVDDRGGEVGPDLSRIGSEKKRDYLLEAIVDPNKTIAKNFESQVIVDADGRFHTGILKEENGKHVKLLTPEGQVKTILQDDIEARKAGKSAMPEDLVKQLTPRDVRDLVEFLTQRRAAASP